MLCGSIGENELFYGLGQRFDSVVRNGTEAMLWNIDADFMLHYEIPKTVDYSYTNIPLLHSLRGYTVFFNTSYAVTRLIFTIGSESPTKRLIAI